MINTIGSISAWKKHVDEGQTCFTCLKFRSTLRKLDFWMKICLKQVWSKFTIDKLAIRPKQLKITENMCETSFSRTSDLIQRCHCTGLNGMRKCPSYPNTPTQWWWRKRRSKTTSAGNIKEMFGVCRGSATATTNTKQLSFCAFVFVSKSIEPKNIFKKLFFYENVQKGREKSKSVAIGFRVSRRSFLNGTDFLNVFHFFLPMPRQLEIHFWLWNGHFEDRKHWLLVFKLMRDWRFSCA